jgi:oxygen-independent coproporphyrinogen-3 oxidase
VYLGGGTPSLLTPAQVDGLLAALRRRHGLAPGAEISLELDPASFDQPRLAGYLAAGVNRVSLGGQSFDDAVLAGLGRRHRGADVAKAASWLEEARGRGALVSWSLDLIQAVPGQSLDGWREQLRRAIATGAPHLSVYDLTIEPGTVFARRLERGQLDLPEPERAADLMDLTWEELTAAGYGHYEISSYAFPGHASRHNRVYWSGAGWWGFGMGATAAPWGERQPRPRTRAAYAAWLEGSLSEARDGGATPAPAAGRDGAGLPLDERLLVGLRRREGVRLPALLTEAGLTPPERQRALAELRRRLAPWLAERLLLEEGPRWRLADPAGLAVSNGVLRELLGWWEHRAGAGRRSSDAAPPRPECAPAAAAG